MQGEAVVVLLHRAGGGVACCSAQREAHGARGVTGGRGRGRQSGLTHHRDPGMPRGFLIKRHSLPPDHDHTSQVFHSLVKSLQFSSQLQFHAEPYMPTPLDLSLKPSSPNTPPATRPPSSPPTRRTNDDTESNSDKAFPKRRWRTPFKKAIRKLNFDEDTTSPVSGTIIRRLEVDEPPLVVRKGDIDPVYNLVEITEEAKEELAKIENRIGDYICRLCKEIYEDAFGLAQHRCSRIVHIEYRCPECDKVFNCPANLASHQRWHRPRVQSRPQASGDLCLPCPVCAKVFRRQPYLSKHLLSHGSPLVTSTQCI